VFVAVGLASWVSAVEPARTVNLWPIRAIILDTVVVSDKGNSGHESDHMGLMHVTVNLRSFGSENGTYGADFLVDTGATDSLAPGAELTKIGVKPAGKMVYKLADGTIQEYQFGLAEIAFMGEVTAGRVIFGPDTAEPLLGVTALESVGITIDPASRTLKRLPAIPLKKKPPDRNIKSVART
jgi:clan AA aspartic protease